MKLPFIGRSQKEERALSNLEVLFEGGGFGYGTKTYTGKNITYDNAIYSSAFAACLVVRAETFGTLPAHIYIDDPAGGKVKATEHPAYKLLKDAPNPTMTASEFWLWKQITEDLYGNAYVYIERAGNRPVALWPLVGTVTPLTDIVDGIKKVTGYEHEYGNQQKKRYLAGDVLHFRSSVSTDGVQGVSLVDIARESIGVDLSAEEFFGRVMSNGTHLGTVLTTSETLTESDFEFLKKQLEDGAGIAPTGKARVFHRGIKPEVLGMSVKDADLTAQRRYVLERICGLTRVPLTLIAEMSHGTYSNTEQLDRQLSKHCIRPLAVVTEQVVNARMLDGAHYMRFDLNGLERGDFSTRMSGYSTGVNAGIFTINEIRAWEELNPVDGGDTPRFPLNSIPLDSLPTVEEQQEGERAVPVQETRAVDTSRANALKRMRLADTWKPVIADAGARIVKREAMDIRKEAKRITNSPERDAQSFAAWTQNYYEDERFTDYYSQQMTPVITAYARQVAEAAADEVGSERVADVEEFVTGYILNAANAHASRSRKQIEKLIAELEGDLYEAVDAKVAEWEERRAETIGNRESVEAGGAAALTAFAAAGIASLMWINTSRNSCPYCDALDGRTVTIGAPFLKDGEAIAPDGVEPMVTTGFKKHPPAHRGCQCQVVPVL